jgi:hypothetical protein
MEVNKTHKHDLSAQTSFVVATLFAAPVVANCPVAAAGSRDSSEATSL